MTKYIFQTCAHQDLNVMYQSIPSLTISPPPPQATPGDSHILVAPRVGFSLLCLARGLPEVCPRSARGVLNQSKSSIILKKSAIFALSLKQMGSSSFHMFIYARSEQCDLGPICTITNTQRIRIYPGKFKFILVKISPDPGHLHGTHAKENQTLFTFLTAENFIRTPLLTRVQIWSVFRFVHYAVNLPG